jgi:hypothetical protein
VAPVTSSALPECTVAVAFYRLQPLGFSTPRKHIPRAFRGQFGKQQAQPTLRRALVVSNRGFEAPLVFAMQKKPALKVPKHAAAAAAPSMRAQQPSVPLC